MRAPLRFAFPLALALLAGSVFAADKSAPIVADVPLPGDTSRFDYASLDTARHLLFIAHLGASEETLILRITAGNGM